MEEFLLLDSRGVMQYYEEDPKTFYKYNYDRSLKNAVEKISCCLTPANPFVFVDYGTADGTIPLLKLPLIKEMIWQKYEKGKEILIALEDVYTQLNSVWQRIEYQEHVSFLTSGVSFYTQCVPANTVHLGQVGIATHWLNNSNLRIKDSIFPNTTQDKICQELVQKTARQDWELFLCHRAKELVQGGVLLCICLGESGDMVEEIKWRPMNNAWEKLYSEGFIAQDEKETAVIHELTRSEQDHKRPFLDPDSPVSQAGLKLLDFEVHRIYYFGDYRKGLADEITEKNREDIHHKLADRYCGLYRSVYYPRLSKALNSYRSEEEKKEIMQRYFENLKLEYLSNRRLPDLEVDCYYHVLIIRKE